MELNEGHFRSLAAKLDGLELSDEEASALRYLVTAGRTTDAEVEGFLGNIFVQFHGVSVQTPPMVTIGSGVPGSIVLGEGDMR